ncbi:PREDICTED: tumor necrosis factor ligand superfamily member 18 [Elephantulus edwardii]|uniref:tumor necrosis factor ligand superfamily member 18 n=1 Tax=Elephantulus edwardii TaxID=28737 RepID=UPI0003F0EAC4|nr:PREDICTED: tumor necrosis factor ligand superfamily member 18 [Elephantulus edwardii]
MNLSHMETIAINHSNPQGAQRSSWKLRLFFSTILFLLLCLFSLLLFLFLSLKNEPCGAKFGPLPARWKTTLSEPHCVAVEEDWKLTILKDGLYIIYSHVVPNTTYNESAPFDVRLYKNESTIQNTTDNSKIQNMGGTYELHPGDIISLRFNYNYQVLKNDTYLGIIFLASPPFIS